MIIITTLNNENNSIETEYSPKLHFLNPMHASIP